MVELAPKLKVPLARLSAAPEATAMVPALVPPPLQTKVPLSTLIVPKLARGTERLPPDQRFIVPALPSAEEPLLNHAALVPLSVAPTRLVTRLLPYMKTGLAVQARVPVLMITPEKMFSLPLIVPPLHCTSAPGW